MKKITKADRMILEDLEERIGRDRLTAAVVPDVDDTEDIRTVNHKYRDENENEPTGIKESIFDFLCRLEGYQVVLKGFHWNADHKSTHELADDIREEIVKFQDEIAEDMMGFLGIRLKPGDIEPDDVECEDIKCLLETLREDVLTLRASVEEEAVCYGLVSILDDMVHFVNKSLYLETFL